MKNMKIYTLFALAMAFMLSAASVNAETNYKYYEMADGAYVRFEVPLEKISVENTRNVNLEGTSQVDSSEPRKWVEKVEMTDGYYVEFPMNAEEIKLALKREAFEKAHKKEQPNAASNQVKHKEYEVIEMADCNFVVFEAKKGIKDIAQGPNVLIC